MARSNGPERKKAIRRYTDFVSEVFDGDGEWVEMPLGDGLSVSNQYPLIYSEIARRVAEVQIVGSVIYARLTQ
jgi:hypothetical protein